MTAWKRPWDRAKKGPVSTSEAKSLPLRGCFACFSRVYRWKCIVSIHCPLNGLKCNENSASGCVMVWKITPPPQKKNAYSKFPPPPPQPHRLPQGRNTRSVPYTFCIPFGWTMTALTVGTTFGFRVGISSVAKKLKGKISRGCSAHVWTFIKLSTKTIGSHSQ